MTHELKITITEGELGVEFPDLEVFKNHETRAAIVDSIMNAIEEVNYDIIFKTTVEECPPLPVVIQSNHVIAQLPNDLTDEQATTLLLALLNERRALDAIIFSQIIDDIDGELNYSHLN